MLLTSLDIDSVMYRVLANSGINDVLSGRVYRGEQRPVNSSLEDIVVNTIAITTSSCPQTATSNVNIYVPDMDVNVDGVVTNMPNIGRLSEITNLVLNILRNAIVEGLEFTPANHIVIAEPTMRQHYSNIRVNWNIQK